MFLGLNGGTAGWSHFKGRILPHYGYFSVRMLSQNNATSPDYQNYWHFLKIYPT